MARKSITGGKAKGSKPAAAATTAAPKARAAKSGERQCAARPNGPYGIDAPKQCTNVTRRPSAALCSVHEPMWRAEARRRHAAKQATQPKVSKASRSKAQQPAADPDDLEAQLEESVKQASTRFASPDLARKAVTKRKAAAKSS